MTTSSPTLRRLVGVLGAVVLLVGVTVVGSRTWAEAAPPVARGLVDGRLAPCASTANCATTNGVGEGLVAPITCTDPAPATRVREAIAERGEWDVASQYTTAAGTYLHVVARTEVLGFLDDLEIHVVPGDDRVRARSASRVGSADGGTNRERLAELAEDLAGRCAGTP